MAMYMNLASAAAGPQCLLCITANLNHEQQAGPA